MRKVANEGHGIIMSLFGNPMVIAQSLWSGGDKPCRPSGQFPLHIKPNSVEPATLTIKLGRRTVTWVPEHSNIAGNEKADRLARQLSVSSMVGPKSPYVHLPSNFLRKVKLKGSHSPSEKFESLPEGKNRCAKDRDL